MSLLAAAAAAPDARQSPLQRAYGRLSDAVDAIEKLPPRERATALDLTARRVSQTLGRHQAVLEEWDLWLR